MYLSTIYNVRERHRRSVVRWYQRQNRTGAGRGEQENNKRGGRKSFWIHSRQGERSKKDGKGRGRRRTPQTNLEKTYHVHTASTAHGTASWMRFESYAVRDEIGASGLTSFASTPASAPNSRTCTGTGICPCSNDIGTCLSPSSRSAPIHTLPKRNDTIREYNRVHSVSVSQIPKPREPTERNIKKSKQKKANIRNPNTQSKEEEKADERRPSLTGSISPRPRRGARGPAYGPRPPAAQ